MSLLVSPARRWRSRPPTSQVGHGAPTLGSTAPPAAQTTSPVSPSRPSGDQPAHRRSPLLVRLGALLALALAASMLVVPPVTPAGAAEVRRITLPIHADHADRVEWTDTYGAPRGGGRSHIGVDMLGEKMIPLVAARSGTITWGRFDNGGGSILKIRDDEGWEYQYIHLNNDSPGTDNGAAACTEVFSARLCGALDGDRFRSGTTVTEGEVIAYLGDGGNAEHTRPHLHFEIYRPSGGGTVPINPTPSVDAALDRLGGGSAPSGPPPVAAPGEDGFTDHLWYRLNGRRPTGSERAAFDAAVASDGIWAALADKVANGNSATSIDRLYLVFFERYPDADGIRYWLDKVGDGHRLEDVAEWFALSAEFEARYGGVDFATFVDRLYLDVLGRSPDENGKRYWLDKLDAGEVNRGTIVVYFAQSGEMRDLTRHRNEIVALTLLRDGTVPDAGAVSSWTGQRSSTDLGPAIASWFPS